MEMGMGKEGWGAWAGCRGQGEGQRDGIEGQREGWEQGQGEGWEQGRWVWDGWMGTGGMVGSGRL